eukprot:4623704-Prorocentrum_lima.AAC.1
MASSTLFFLAGGSSMWFSNSCPVQLGLAAMNSWSRLAYSLTSASAVVLVLTLAEPEDSVLERLPLDTETGVRGARSLSTAKAWSS